MKSYNQLCAHKVDDEEMEQFLRKGQAKTHPR
jgi:hypothetical protein